MLCICCAGKCHISFCLDFCRGAGIGYLPCQPSPDDILSTIILNAIKAFRNLRVAIFMAIAFHPNTFTRILQSLVTLNTQISLNSSSETSPCRLARHGLPYLRELAVNASCTNENNAPILAQISGLSKLSIYSPTRAILDLLPGWLRRLSDSLRELHLKVGTLGFPIGWCFSVSGLSCFLLLAASLTLLHWLRFPFAFCLYDCMLWLYFSCNSWFPALSITLARSTSFPHPIIACRGFSLPF